MTNTKLPAVEPPLMGDAFENSPAAIARFPFPFLGDSYMYSVNLTPAGKGAPAAYDEHLFDVDEHYVAEMKLRALILEKDPDRCIALPHMMEHQWDLLELIMEKYSQDYPEHFSLERDGDDWHWSNRLLDIEERFVFGDVSSLPCEPMEYITRQAQGDWILMDHREGDFWLDAGTLTLPADWSLRFDLGMSFDEWHGPVPLAHEAGVFKRAKQFLNRIRPDEPWQRLNWTITIGRRWDTSSDTYHEWGPDRLTVTPENVGKKAHLRVELQVLPRLARSNGLLFQIRTYMLSLEELSTNPAWAKRLRRVLQTLPPEISAYKGMTLYREMMIDWLEPFEDGI